MAVGQRSVLRFLSLKSCQLGERSSVLVANALTHNSTLTHLNLSANGISKIGGAASL